MKVGDPGSMSTCTTQIEYAIVDPLSRRNRGYRMVIVDTPGFDDSSKSDSEVLKEIASWLQKQ